MAGSWGGGGGGHAKGSNRVVTKEFRQLSSCGPWEKKRRSVCAIRTGTRMTYLFSAPFLTDRPLCRQPWGRGSKE